MFLSGLNAGDLESGDNDRRGLEIISVLSTIRFYRELLSSVALEKQLSLLRAPPKHQTSKPLLSFVRRNAHQCNNSFLDARLTRIVAFFAVTNQKLVTRIACV
jgi:hypothetical protein